MPKKAAEEKTVFGANLIEGMKLVLAHQRGKIDLEPGLAEACRREAIRKRVKPYHSSSRP